MYSIQNVLIYFILFNIELCILVVIIIKVVIFDSLFFNVQFNYIHCCSEHDYVGHCLNVKSDGADIRDHVV